MALARSALAAVLVALSTVTTAIDLDRASLQSDPSHVDVSEGVARPGLQLVSSDVVEANGQPVGWARHYRPVDAATAGAPGTARECVWWYGTVVKAWRWSGVVHTLAASHAGSCRVFLVYAHASSVRVDMPLPPARAAVWRRRAKSKHRAGYHVFICVGVCGRGWRHNRIHALSDGHGRVQRKLEFFVQSRRVLGTCHWPRTAAVAPSFAIAAQC